MMNDESPPSVSISDVHHSSFIIHHSEPASLVPPIVLDLSPPLHSPLFTLHSPIGSFLFSYLVGALLLGVGLLIGWTWRISHDYQPRVAQSAASQSPEDARAEAPSVGRISGIVDCRWAKWSAASGQWAVVGESEIRNPKSQISNQELLVPLGAKYNLTSGFMEITYDTGAKVILQGPCTYEIESAAGGFLSFGKLTARVEGKAEGGGRRAEGEVSGGQWAANGKSEIPFSALRPPPSALFSVRTPSAIVTDLGTEFGVEVDKRGGTTSHVFRGAVELRIANAGSTGYRTIVLIQQQAARVEVGRDGVPRASNAAFRSDDFVRRMPAFRRLPIGVFNTGVDVAEGQPDRHWWIVAVSNDPKFQARPAVVSRVAEPWLPNNARSKWISLVGDCSFLPHDVTYTFRTTFSLTGSRLGEAALLGEFIVNNNVRAIRLNGHEARVLKHGYMEFDYFHPFSITEGFVAGANVLEIDVENGVPPEVEQATPGKHEGRSPMGLRVELEGSVNPWIAPPIASHDSRREEPPK